jgi:hypothetical protein
MEFKTPPTPGPDGSGSQMFHTESWRSDKVQDTRRRQQAAQPFKRSLRLMAKGKTSRGSHLQTSSVGKTDGRL